MKPLRPSYEVLKDWANDLAKKLERPVEQILTRGLNIYDFNASVEILYPLDLSIRFRNAFAVIRPETNEVAVFTEHVGYREFDLEEGMQILEITTKHYYHEML